MDSERSVDLDALDSIVAIAEAALVVDGGAKCKSCDVREHRLARALVACADRLRVCEKAIECGPKTVGNDDNEYSTPQSVDFLREMATREGVPTYRCVELRQAANRLDALYSSYLAVCPHETAEVALVERVRVCEQALAAVEALRKQLDPLNAELGLSAKFGYNAPINATQDERLKNAAAQMACAIGFKLDAALATAQKESTDARSLS